VRPGVEVFVTAGVMVVLLEESSEEEVTEFERMFVEERFRARRKRSLRAMIAECLCAFVSTWSSEGLSS